MIRIQKTKNILGILFFSLLSVSCQEWLDVSPSTEVKYDDLFSYKNGFKDQLTGVYTALCSEELYGAHLGFADCFAWIEGASRADECGPRW